MNTQQSNAGPYTCNIYGHGHGYIYYMYTALFRPCRKSTGQGRGDLL
jgi:hypothetical protein